MRQDSGNRDGHLHHLRFFGSADARRGHHRQPVIQFLKEKFSLPVLGEIDVCFDLGSQGRFGEIYKISLKTLVDWIQGYKSCAERLEALAVRQQELESCQQKRRSEFENSDVYERDTLEKIFGSYVIGRFLLNPVVPGIFVSLLKRHILAKSDFERTGVEPTVTENDTEKSDVKKLRMVVINCFNRLIDCGNSLKLLTAEERIKYGL